MNIVELHARLHGLRYRYQIRGEEGAPPLLLLHGFTGRSDNWVELTALLGGDYRCISVDLIGHGETDAPNSPLRYAMPAAAADLVALLDHLGLARVHLYGYSMGGRLALYTALHYAQRFESLTLESASPGLRTEDERAARRAQDDFLAESIVRDGVGAFVDRWEALPLFASQANVDLHKRAMLRESRLGNRVQGLANSLRGMGTGVQPPLWDALHELGLPTRLIVGALDTKFTVINGAMQAVMPGSRLHIVRDAGHSVHFERPVAVAALLRGASG